MLGKNEKRLSVSPLSMILSVGCFVLWGRHILFDKLKMILFLVIEWDYIEIFNLYNKLDCFDFQKFNQTCITRIWPWGVIFFTYWGISFSNIS